MKLEFSQRIFEKSSNSINFIKIRPVGAELRADSHYTSRFRSVAERHRSVKFSHVYLNGYVHTDRNVSVNVSVPFRRCRRARLFHGTARVLASLLTFSILILRSLTVSSSKYRPIWLHIIDSLLLN